MDNNWLIDYFSSGFYEKYWGWQLDEENPRELASDALKLLGAASGHILDWCGGWGRVSIFFAEKGFFVTILDIMKEYLQKAETLFSEKGLTVRTIQSDCRVTPASLQANYATCFFNTVGFFSDAEQVGAFKSLYNALKPGARFLLDCMNLFYLTDYIKPVNETLREDGCIFRQRNSIDFSTNTMHSFFEIENPQGIIEEEKEFFQRLYTPMDLKNLLEAAGFSVKDIYGSMKGEDISFKSPKIVIIAEKNN